MEEFIKELQELNLQQVEERMTSLDVEVRSMTNVEAVNTATEQKKALVERKAELQELETRKSEALQIKEKKVDAVILERGGQMEQSVDMKMEYRNAWSKQIRGLQLNDVEQRAWNSAGADAVIPETLSSEIIKKIEQRAPMLSEITLLRVPGGVKFAVEGAKTAAALHTENASITADTDTLTSVTLSTYEITKLVQMSKSVSKMSIPAFEAWITDMIAEKIAAKITALLISGTGSSQPEGVDSITWSATNSVTVTASGATTSANVQKLIGLLPAAYDTKAKFLMSKKTLFTEFMPLQDNSKNAIVTVVGNEYYVYGYKVMLDDTMAIGNAILGDFTKLVANMPEDINITSDFDLKTNSYLFLGCAMFDSKVALDEAFVKLVKATA